MIPRNDELEYLLNNKRKWEEMNKPCENCSKADYSREGYYKCDVPCNQAEQCYEADRKALEIFTNDIQEAGDNG